MKGGSRLNSNVQADMQWIRRCKQEEQALIDSVDDDEDD